jgi:hypothetical protein
VPAGRPHLMQYGGSTALCPVISNFRDAQAPRGVSVPSTLMDSPAPLILLLYSPRQKRSHRMRSSYTQDGHGVADPNSLRQAQVGKLR